MPQLGHFREIQRQIGTGNEKLVMHKQVILH